MKTLKLLLTVGLMAGMTNVAEGMQGTDKNGPTSTALQRQEVDTKAIKDRIDEIALAFASQLIAFKTYIDFLDLEHRKTPMDTQEYRDHTTVLKRAFERFLSDIRALPPAIVTAKATEKISVEQYDNLLNSLSTYIETLSDQATKTFEEADQSLALYELNVNLIDEATYQARMAEAGR